MKALKLMIVLPLMALFIQNAAANGQSEVLGHLISDKDFRVFNKESYKILSSNGIIIYSKTGLVWQGKGPKPTELFFFSESASSPILSLTIANLESVYAKNQKFMYAVESLFKSDRELSSYDAYNKQFKLAYLYAENVK